MGMTSNRPRRVLILTPSSRLLGARRSLLALAEGMDPQRWRPVVCGQSFGQLGEALAERDIRMEVVKLGWWRKGKYFLWRPFAISRLTQLARQIGADLIHCNELYPNPYAVRAAQNVKGPEGSPCEGQPIPVITHIRLDMKEGMIRKYDLDRADCIAVPSEALGHEFDEWPDKSSRVRVIYNGVNMEEYRRRRTAAEARRQIGLPEGGIVMAAVGQIGPRKGGDLILDGFERIADKYPQLRLFFVGDPHRGQESFAEALKTRAAEGPFRDRIFFFPFTENILPYYEASDVNLLISREEGFGRTLIEAGAVGVPSIGTRVGGIAEVVVDGVTGRLVPPEDPKSLAEAMGQMMDEESLRRSMADAAFRRAAQTFSINSHVDQVMDMYDDILESKARAR